MKRENACLFDKDELYNIQEWEFILNNLLLKIKISKLPIELIKNLKIIFKQLIIAQKSTNDYYEIAKEAIEISYKLRDKLFNPKSSLN